LIRFVYKNAAMSRGKNWCFTLNNWNDEDYERLTHLVEKDECVYIIFGKEVGESGTPHLQGFIAFSKRVYLTDVKKRISNTAHFELARMVPEAIEYCKKDGDVYEAGIIPAGQGKRTDIDEFKTDVKAGMLNLKEIREKHSTVYAKYKGWVMEYVTDNAPSVPIYEYPLHEWQKELLTKLEGDPDDRTITFIVDQTGNNGKTWFAHWYSSKDNKCQVMCPGRRADMAYILRTDIRALIMDAPRSKQGEFIQYDFLEDVKNGYVFSSKYESSIKTLANVHLVVLMNEPPDLTKLSYDRYDITYL
jgi:predicted small secreted protein